MQPEVSQNPQQNPAPQSPVVQQAFQGVAPHPPVQPLNQPMMSVNPHQHKSHNSAIVTAFLALLLIVAVGFGGWAFMSRQDYKDNSDQKSAEAVEKALAVQKIELDAAYAEKDKSPNATYNGKAEAGSIQVQYPRTWSAHVIEQSDGLNPIDAYFHPGFVPDTTDESVAFALRIEVVSTPYAETMTEYEASVSQGGVTVAPYRFAKVPNSLGSIVTGAIEQGRENVQGTLVVMPIRDKTLKVWTESNTAFLADFNSAVLANLSFIP